MALAEKISRGVDRGVRSRGREYFAWGKVRIQSGSRTDIRAQVAGSSTYKVELRLENNRLHVYCSCPFFHKNETVCKHIWAAILAADKKNFLSAAWNIPSVGITGLGVDIYNPDYDYGGNDDDDEAEDLYEKPQPARESKKPAPPPQPAWKQQLNLVHLMTLEQTRAGAAAPSGSTQLVYLVDATETKRKGRVVLQIVTRERRINGEWGKLKFNSSRDLPQELLTDPTDKQILSLLAGSDAPFTHTHAQEFRSEYFLREEQQELLLPLICATNRCRVYVPSSENEGRALRWDAGDPWELWLDIHRAEIDKQFIVDASLRRGEQRLTIKEPEVLVSGGLAIINDFAVRVNDFGAFQWAAMLRTEGSLRVPEADRDALLETIMACPRVPRLSLPPEMSFQTVQLAPRPRLVVKAPPNEWREDRFDAAVSFDYSGALIPAGTPALTLFQKEPRRLIMRDVAAERAAFARLAELGVKPQRWAQTQYELELPTKQLPRVVAALVKEQWRVEAEGKLYRQAVSFNVQVASKIDWFELQGEARFDGASASFPALLAALKRGDGMVRLDDGSFGMLPEEWLEKLGMFASLGKSDAKGLTFTKNQAGLLDALLAAQPEITCDATFSKVREELRVFEKIEPSDPPAGFTGTLRNYQRDGLGWFAFLQRFEFGGCLADDMGLGKTVQVLALLEARRQMRGKKSDPGPSLVVVPKSLVFNWKQEAARFAPKVRVLDHTGPDRKQGTEHFTDVDLVLTTYGTLRNDAAAFKDFDFDYVILDEAQAVKNSATASAKAVRLLRGKHRLALSGTPIENHIGELWSLFEFLNPGMLGTASIFQSSGAGGRDVSPETRSILARALRPFILRRTKEQVAKDLPQKMEQTLFCELEPAQRKLYNELRDHYKASLLSTIEKDGLNKSKIQILEALLRLRQAACHPALIDKEDTETPSAKLDMLLPQLEEVLEEDHKVLVFSQFTSFLALVRKHLDEKKIVYEYLDGKTRDRAERVERFQTDPKCKLFLISLKAGGLGLNLTAAEYVYLLDPWWNPAVEAQAIDRAHRIGQTRQVFACRLIARDTVEEKVLELQQSKRDLADAILNADNSLIRNLKREDLELLLS
jgi:hypothetical protein